MTFNPNWTKTPFDLDECFNCESKTTSGFYHCLYCEAWYCDQCWSKSESCPECDGTSVLDEEE